ncbi:MAG: hypothetical protein ABR600_05880, partial [Actinomycetota bacterium]
RFPKARSLALGTSDAVREPESAITEAVWLAPGTVDGLSLRDLLDPPWRRWRDAVERERTEREQREAIERAIWDAPAEHRREMLRDEARNFFPHSGYMRSSPSEHEKTVAQLLANEGEMTKAERTAFTAFCDRRTEVCGEHLRVAYNLIHVDTKGGEAVALDAVHDKYLDRQRRFVGELHIAHPESPSVAWTMSQLDRSELLTLGEERELPSDAAHDDAVLVRLREQVAEYLAWREQRVRAYRRGAGIVRGLLFDKEAARPRIDRDHVFTCRWCRHVVPLLDPPRRDAFSRHGDDKDRCPFDSEHRLSPLPEAIDEERVEEDGAGFYRACRPPVPGWVRQLQSLPPGFEEARLR